LSITVVVFLTYTPQMSHHPLSWAGSLGLDVHLLFLSLCDWKINKLHGIKVWIFIQNNSRGQSHKFAYLSLESCCVLVVLEVLDSAFVPHGCA